MGWRFGCRVLRGGEIKIFSDFVNPGSWTDIERPSHFACCWLRFGWQFVAVNQTTKNSLAVSVRPAPCQSPRRSARLVLCSDTTPLRVSTTTSTAQPGVLNLVLTFDGNPKFSRVPPKTWRATSLLPSRLWQPPPGPPGRDCCAHGTRPAPHTQSSRIFRSYQATKLKRPNPIS